MRMTVLIVEDEPKARQHLQNLIEHMGKPLTVVACLESVRATIDWLTHHKTPDLILMDIQLSDGLSFEVLDQVEVAAPIIFTTAYDNYAIQAFKTSGIDYLLKPITQENIEEAFERFFEHRNGIGMDWTLRSMDALQYYRHNAGLNTYKKRFLMKLGDALVPVLTDQIAYFFRQEIVFAKTFEGELFPMDVSLGQLQSKLNPKEFVRLNRQILTNIASITKLKSSKPGQLVLELHPSYHERIEISQERSSRLKQLLDSDA